MKQLAYAMNALEYDLDKAVSFAVEALRNPENPNVSMLYHFLDAKIVGENYISAQETLKRVQFVRNALTEYGVISEDDTIVDTSKMVLIIEALLIMHDGLKKEIYNQMADN